jgi:ABC-type glycerol-3-phosphate transport system permease component
VWQEADNDVVGQTPAPRVKLGAALLATIPVAIIVLIFQRFFIRGANEGGVKG